MKGKLNLYNSDCMEALEEMDDDQFDLAIVDPPYGIGAGKMTMGSGKHSFKRGGWDAKIPEEVYFTELFRVSRNQIVWGGNYFSKYLPPSPHWLVWDKKNPNLSFAEGELAWVRSGTNLRIFQHYSARVEAGGKIHPTQKPTELYRWILSKYAKEGDTILDTHLGSGSIAIACYDMGFDLTGYEIDKDYFDAMQKRIKNHTDQMVMV